VVVTVEHGRAHHSGLATVHQTVCLPVDHRTIVDGIPVTNVARTLVDSAKVARRGRVEQALEDALGRRLVSLPELGRCFGLLARPGRPGVELMSTLLDDRGPGYVPAASELERLLFAAIPPGAVRQYHLDGVGRVDGAYVPQRVLVEGDGRLWHTRVRDFERDRRRDREAVRAGWRPLRFTAEDLRYDCAGVWQTVADTLALAA
jgi:hypothetical protein